MEICRTCLSPSHPCLSILSEKQIVAEKIKIIADIDVMENTDNLPTAICTLCSKNIETYFQFREQIQKVDKLLKLQLQNNPRNSEIYNDEIQSNKLTIKETSMLGTKITLSTEPSIPINNRDQEMNVKSEPVITHETILTCEEIPFKNEENITILIDNEPPSIEESLMYEEIPSYEEILSYEETPYYEESETTPILKKSIQILQFETEPPDKYQELIPINDEDADTQDLPLREIIKSGIPEQKVYTCDNCKTFSTISVLLYYKHIVYKVCQLGGKITKPELLPGIYGCERCIYLTPSKARMNSHIEKHKFQDKRLLKCNICNFTTNSSNKMGYHIRSEHNKQKVERLPCEICGKFYNKPGLKSHLLTHSQGVKCDECGKTFTTIYNLKTHAKGHVRRDCVCEICGKSFEFEGRYSRHIKLHRTKFKKKTCEMCGKVFQANVFKNHMRTHTGEKPFKCEFCNFKCQRKYNLKLHMRMHTNGKPYKCDLCGKTFRQNISLKEHMQKQHDITLQC